VRVKVQMKITNKAVRRRIWLDLFCDGTEI
jgi:hypothetical protein